MTRSRTSLRQRRARLRAKAWQVGQCAVAAGVAWTIATDVFGHRAPFFAPVAAVVCLGTSYGQRLRRVGEVTVGVAVGRLRRRPDHPGARRRRLADRADRRALAMSTALLLDQGNLLVTQAAVQAVVVATLLPYPGAAFSRWTDALIGGGGGAGGRGRRTPGAAAATSRAGGRRRAEDLCPAAGGCREHPRR